MKTIRVSDGTHKKLTEILGRLTAETGKMQTYEDVINTLLTVYNAAQRNYPQVVCNVEVEKSSQKGEQEVSDGS